MGQPLLDPISLQGARTPCDDAGLVGNDIPDPETRHMLIVGERDSGAFATTVDAPDRDLIERKFAATGPKRPLRAMEVGCAAITKRIHCIARADCARRVPP